MKVTKTDFGKTKDGKEIFLYTLESTQTKVKITNYGCIITSIETPDKNGKLENIACGFDEFNHYVSKQYLDSYPYFGCILGRYANRIANGKYTINGVEYSGVINNGKNHLHGGTEGFDKKVWNVEIFESENNVGLKCSYSSPDGEEGYPGNLNVNCTYTLNNNGKLQIDYEAKTDKETIINLSNHTYFNLTAGKENILNHELELTAKHYTESIDMIPNGKMPSVSGTPFDFTQKKALGKDIKGLADGYDLNMILDNNNGDIVYAGCLSEPKSRRFVKVYTTQPGIQLYTGFWIPELIIDGTSKFGKFSGVALETQHYPDSPNHSNFPSAYLKPNEIFKETTIYEFGVEKA